MNAPRVLKVEKGTRNVSGDPRPRLRLCGKWLWEWGFDAGQRIGWFQDSARLGGLCWIARPDQWQRVNEKPKPLMVRTVQPPREDRLQAIEFDGPALVAGGFGYSGGATHARLFFVEPGLIRVEAAVVETIVRLWSGRSYAPESTRGRKARP